MKHTHLVRCTTDADPFLTKGKVYSCWLDYIVVDDGEPDACGVTDDQGDGNYFMFYNEYEIVGVIGE